MMIELLIRKNFVKSPHEIWYVLQVIGGEMNAFCSISPVLAAVKSQT